MTVPRRCLAVLAIGTCLGLKQRGLPCIFKALVVTLGLILVTGATAVAQVRPDVRDRVVPAVIQISIVAEFTSNGITEPRVFPVGSGTVVSPNGHILTNWHVVNMAEHQKMLDSWETQAASEGQPITIELIEESLLVLMSDGENPPAPRYIASIAAADEVLDLAVLQVVGDGTGLIDPKSLNLPFVPLGDSNAIGLGDPIDIFGYPGIASGALTYTQGVVSGFTTEGDFGRAWIITDATMSGGSSGGTAVNRDGALIGVPTQGSSLDCRPGDVNRDGRLDAQDVGCIPTGGSLGELRPINLALDLLFSVGWTEGGRNGPTPTPIPTATLVLSPPLTPTPTSTTESQDGAELLSRLPNAPSLDHASCFGIVDDGTQTFEQLLERFSGVPDAGTRLELWGWQASAFRQFGCDGPPEGEAGWIDISVHLFGDSLAAQEAVDYFAAVRAEGGPLIPVEAPAIGDHAAALSGPASNGKEFTIYASQGPLLVRVTGVSPSGIPFINVLTVTQAMLAAQQGQPQLVPTPLVQSPSLPASAYLPGIPLVRHRECFEVFSEGVYSYGDVVDALLPTGLSQSQFDGLGWRDGVYRVFTCDEPPVGRASQIDVVIHQFQDAQSAQQALPFARGMYVPGENEEWACETAGQLVVCVVGRSLSGSPLSDVHFVLNQVVDSAR